MFKFPATLTAVLALSVSSASAATMTASYRVTATVGVPTQDDLDLYYNEKDDFSGDDFVIKFVYDTGLGSLTTLGGGEYLNGGADYGQPVNTRVVVMHLGTGSVDHMFGAQSSTVGVLPSGAFHSVSGLGPFGADASLELMALGVGFPASVATSFFSGPIHQPGAGFFKFTAADGRVTAAKFSVTSLSIYEGSAVPEPATWAMMVVGFGAAGSAIRRLRRLPKGVCRRG